MKTVDGFWPETGVNQHLVLLLQTVGQVGSILLLGLQWWRLVASSIYRCPPPSLSETFSAADDYSHVASEIAAGCRPGAAASSGRASPTICPTLGRVLRQLVTAILHPKCSKKWGCSEVQAHFLFHLSTCEIDFSHVGFKVEGRIFKSTFVPLQVQGKKTPDGDRLTDRSTCRYVRWFCCLWKDNCVLE